MKCVFTLENDRYTMRRTIMKYIFTLVNNRYTRWHIHATKETFLHKEKWKVDTEYGVYVYLPHSNFRLFPPGWVKSAFGTAAGLESPFRISKDKDNKDNVQY